MPSKRKHFKCETCGNKYSVKAEKCLIIGIRYKNKNCDAFCDPPDAGMCKKCIKIWNTQGWKALWKVLGKEKYDAYLKGE